MKSVKWISLALAFCMVLSLGAFASSDMPDTSMGGRAASAPPDNSTRAVDILGSRAAVYFDYDEDGYTVSQALTEDYSADGLDGVEAPASGEPYVLGGIDIRCGAVRWDEEELVGNSGIVVNSRTDETTPFVLGGEEALFDAPNGGTYNSVIVMSVDPDEPLPERATETAPGVGIAYNGSSIELKNVYVEAAGTGRPCIHIPASTRDKNVSQKGELLLVDSYIRNYSTRATLLMGGDVYALKSDIITDSWGALSFDNTQAAMYVADCLVNSTGYSGYGVYDAAGCTAYFYGIRDIAGDTGVTVCRTAVLYTGGLDEVPAEVADRYDGAGDMTEPTATEDGRSFIAGGYAALMMHADMSGADSQAQAYLSDTVLSTEDEDVVFHDGASISDEAAAAAYASRSAVSYLQWKDLAGAAALLKSHSGKLVFDGCDLRSRTGVAVRTAFVYDAMASGIYPVDGTEYIGDEVVFRDMDVEGDVIHDDYMRKLELTLEDATLTGRVTSGTCAGWNAKYASIDMDELAAVGADLSETDEDTIRRSFVYNDSYETVWGVRMAMDAGSVWTVTGDSNLYSFTMEDGAVVAAPEGAELAIYVDCGMSGDEAQYDTSVGTRIETFAPGVEYTGVVIVVEEASGEADASGEGISIELDDELLDSLGIHTAIVDGAFTVSLGGLLDALGADVSYDEETGTFTIEDESGALGILMDILGG